MSEPNPITMLALMLLALIFGCASPQRQAPLLQPVPPPPQNASTWWDAVESRWWVVGDRLVDWGDANAACHGSYALPSADALKNAATLGICEGRDCTFGWGPSVSRTEALTIDFATGKTPNKLKSEAGAVAFCVEVKQ